MIEGFWLGFSGWGGSEGSLSFGGGCSRGEELDLFGNGATEIIELSVDERLAKYTIPNEE